MLLSLSVSRTDFLLSLSVSRIWQEILRTYDADHLPSRLALGFKRANDIWMVNASHVFPGADNPDRRALQKVEVLWKKTARKIA